jgi:2-polyprenyl-3-methyl-5-hydroxy-6-metoxy-1,4-benzoquinol methylase
MANNKAQKIIERAMTDRTVYDAMAARESEVWGKILPALERSEARAADATASKSLRVARHQASLILIAREKGLRFERGLTLGCGAGRLERSLLEHGICQSFHGIDISEKAVVDAQETAKRDGLSLTYEIGDLNFIELPEKAFDLVVAQTSLHHVLFLEHIAEQVWGTLKDQGYLWIHDFIGETQGQYDPKRLDIINRLLSILPEKFRTNKINGQVTTQIERPEPGHLASPFETIRSEEIVTIFERWFTIEWKMEFTSLLHLVAPPGTRAAYMETEDTKTLFEVLILLDDLCTKEGIAKPIGGQYLMRPRANDTR